MRYEIIQGDCLDLLRGFTVVHAEPYHHIEYLDLPDNSIDAIVTDPPYALTNRAPDTPMCLDCGYEYNRGFQIQGHNKSCPKCQSINIGGRRKGRGFMGKEWDAAIPGVECWTEALRVAKPGAYLVAFGGTRTHHRLTCAIEDAGWQIRDCLMWLYGSGFPKSHNVASAIDKRAGFPNRGRAIPTASTYQASDTERENKLTSNPVPEYEPQTEAAKQWEGWGTALAPSWEPIILARKPFKRTVADNVIKHGTGALNIDASRFGSDAVTINRFDDGMKPFGNGAGHPYTSSESKGYWPKNCLLDEESAQMVDAQSGERKAGNLDAVNTGIWGGCGRRENIGHKGSPGGASRFFYTAKASRSEKEGGLDGIDPQTVDDGRAKSIDNPYLRGETKRHNLHPTVKPLDLMRWLVRLVTPPGGVVLDPFAGSGTTICAARIEGFSGIGIELEHGHCETARRRVAWAGVEAGDATAEDADAIGKPIQLGLLTLDD